MQPIERFDPELMGGRLLEAEHLARYHWAAALVRGKRVLDAGCGTGYGSELLAREGAAAVVGVDVDEEAVEKAKAAATAATFAVADLRKLPADLGEFDAVVCFEVLEHLEEPDAALDALASVLAPGGILVVSSPNRDVYPPGNPYHKHEFLPEELAETLAARFAHVRLVRQHDWLAAALFEDGDFERLGPVPAPVAKAVPGEPGKELYSVGLASDVPLPDTAPFVMLTRTADVRWWQETVDAKDAEVRAKTEHVRQLEGWLQERDEELKDARAANAELQEVVAGMQATRVWRVGTAYWRLRDRVLRRSLG